MPFDWIRHSRAARWFFAFGLILVLLMAGFFGLPLIRSFLAGQMLDISELGRFVLMASLVPLVFVQVFRARTASMPESTFEMALVRIFEESHDERLLNLCAFWSLTLGMFVHTLTSDGDWSGVIFFAFMCCVGVFNLYRRPAKLTLSVAGIDASWVKAGLIPWHDVRSVELKRRLGSSYVAIEIADPKKYGLKQSTLAVTSILFSNVTVPNLLHAIKGRHEISTLNNSVKSPHQGPMV